MLVYSRVVLVWNVALVLVAWLLTLARALLLCASLFILALWPTTTADTRRCGSVLECRTIRDDLENSVREVTAL